MTEQGVQLLQQLEGFRGMPYKDSAGKLTIGIGTLLPLTEAEGRLLMLWRLKPVEAAVAELVTVRLSANQRDALASFVYNVGLTAFKNSSLLKHLNAGDYAAVPAQMKRWNKETVHGVKRVSQGLVNRRAKEAALWEA